MSEPIVIPEINATALRFAQPVIDRTSGEIIGMIVAIQTLRFPTPRPGSQSLPTQSAPNLS